MAAMSAIGRYCCKSPFALVIKNSPGCRRDFRVKMWGTSSVDDKLADDLSNAMEGTRIGGRRSFFAAGNLAPANRGLLQQYRSTSDLALGALMSASTGSGRMVAWAYVKDVPILLQKSFCTGDQKFSGL